MPSSERNSPGLNSVHLVNAVLCADCEVISDSAGDTCQVCGSRSLMSLGRVLGGSIEGKRAVLIHVDQTQLRNMFTVLVNPDAASVVQSRRKRKQLPLFEKITGKSGQ
jgi:hypothetical protein